jgi:hypothetical protein
MKRNWFSGLLMVGLAFGVIGCRQEGEVEQTGEKIEDKMDPGGPAEEAGEAMDEGVEETGEQMEEAGEAVEEKAQ